MEINSTEEQLTARKHHMEVLKAVISLISKAQDNFCSKTKTKPKPSNGFYQTWENATGLINIMVINVSDHLNQSPPTLVCDFLYKAVSSLME